MTPRPATRAFTLLEVLLASSLAVVLGLAVAQVLYVSQRARQRVEARGAERALSSALARRLRADLQAVLPPAGLYASGLTGESEVGGGMGEELLDPSARERTLEALDSGDEPPPWDERDRLVLAVQPPAPAFGDAVPPGEGALWQVTYWVDDDPDTEERGLVRLVERRRTRVPTAEPEPPVELAGAVVGLDVQYWDGQAWQETWDSAASETMPLQVRVRLAVAEDEDPDADGVRTLTVAVAPPAGRLGEIPEATQ